MNFEAFNSEVLEEHPQEILKRIFEFSENKKIKPAISFSGAEDVVLIDMAWSISKNFDVFTLDTGRLHNETYQFIDEVNKHYGIKIDILSPDKKKLEELTKEKGLFSFYKDGHAECCGIRKVDSLRTYLRNKSLWVTGQRKDQSPTRSELDVIHIDTAFKGKNNNDLIKVNPLANFSSKQTWHYILSHSVPYNKLHDQGYTSIGCQPCTRAVNPGEHERAGRWWWEEATKKECGLHISSR